MSNRNLKVRSVLALAAIVGVGSVARGGVTLTQGYTSGQISNTSNFAAGTTTAVALSATGFNAVIIGPGQYFRFGVTEVISGDTNPVSNDAWDQDNVNNQGNSPQPASLGILSIAMQVGSTDTAGVLVSPLASSGVSKAALPTKPSMGWSTTSAGDVNGGLIGDTKPISGAAAVIPDAGDSGGATPTSADAPLTDFTAAGPDPAFFTQLAYADLDLGDLDNTTQVVLTPTIYAPGTEYWVATSLGTVGGTDAGYAGQFFGSNDTITALSPIVLDPVPEPSSLGILGIGSFALLARRRRKIAH